MRYSFVATVTDTWLMRFSSGVARPWARGSQRLSVGPAPTTATSCAVMEAF